MSRLADRAWTSSLASFGTALLPEEHGGPSPAQFVERVDRYVTRLPATSRVAVRGGLLSLAAASYLTTGRSLGRLRPEARAQVLHRIAGLSPDAAAAVEGLKAIVLLANGADNLRADELLSRAQQDDPVRPDAELTVTPSTESRSVVTADVVIVGSGAGGAMVARTLARAGFDAVVLEEGRRWTVEEFRTTHPIDRYAGLYRGAGSTIALGTPVGGAADRPRGGRHHRRQLRHLLSAFARGAAALARRVRSRPRRPGSAVRSLRRRRAHASGRPGARCRSWPQRQPAASGRHGTGLASGAHPAQRTGL